MIAPDRIRLDRLGCGVGGSSVGSGSASGGSVATMPPALVSLIYVQTPTLTR
jgi:hypothetical protein